MMKNDTTVEHPETLENEVFQRVKSRHHWTKKRYLPKPKIPQTSTRTRQLGFAREHNSIHGKRLGNEVYTLHRGCVEHTKKRYVHVCRMLYESRYIRFMLYPHIKSYMFVWQGLESEGREWRLSRVPKYDDV